MLPSCPLTCVPVARRDRGRVARRSEGSEEPRTRFRAGGGLVLLYRHAYLFSCLRSKEFRRPKMPSSGTLGPEPKGIPRRLIFSIGDLPAFAFVSPTPIHGRIQAEQKLV